MSRPSREWKSFPDRWRRSSRLEQFLVWSVVLHAALVLVGWVPARSAQRRHEELQARHVAEAERREAEKKEAAAEAEKKIHELLKRELAEEQLKPFFTELVSEFLDEPLAEMLWDELLEDLDLQFEELVDLLEMEEQFDQIAFEAKLDELKTELLAKLNDRLQEERQKQILADLLQKARDLAQNLVERYRQQLAERIGQPVGDSLAKAVRAEQQQVEQMLDKADAQLAAAVQAATDAEKSLDTAAQELGSLSRTLKQAEDAGDKKAAEAAAAKVKLQRSPLAAAAGKAKLAVAPLNLAADLVKNHFPDVAAKLAKTATDDAGTGQQQADAAATDAAAGKPGESGDKAAAAKRQIARARGAAEAARAELQLQRALEQATRLAQATQDESTAAKQIAERRATAEKSDDSPAKSAALTKSDGETTAAAQRAGALAQETTQLASRVGKLTPGDTKPGDAKPGDAKPGDVKPGDVKPGDAKPGDAKPGDAKPGDAKPGDTSPTRERGSSGDTKPGDSKPLDPPALAKAAEGAKDTLADAQKSLQEKQPGAAQAKLKNAAEQLGEVTGQLRAALRQRGRPDEAVGEAVLREVEAMRQGKLAEGIRSEFEKQYQEKALPAILDRVAEAGTKRAQAEQAFSKAFKDQLRSEMNRVFGKLGEQTEAGKQVAQSAATKLPGRQPDAGETVAGASSPRELPSGAGSPSHDPGTAAQSRINSPRAAQAAEGAATAAQQLAQKTIPSVVQSAVNDPGFAKLGEGKAENDRKVTTLLQRLENLGGQLGNGRRDFLGDADGTAAAAAWRRQRGRKGGLVRLGTFGDVDAKAYREMLATMEARGQVTGAAFDLQTVEGETSTASDERLLRPALVSVPTVPVETPPADAPPRTVQEPSFQSNRFNGIPFVTSDKIKIDGDLGDWADLREFLLDPVQKGLRAAKTKPANQRAWVAYDSRGLLIAYDVIDCTGEIETKFPLSAFWMNDCIEIFIDTLNTKYSQRGEMSTHQFCSFPFGHPALPDATCFEHQAVTEDGKVDWKRHDYGADVCPRAAKKTEQGWTVEMLIPKSLLRKGAIKPGRIIGFNLQLDTGCDLYYYWTCAKQIISSQHPNTWGDIQFLGSDAKIEVLDDQSAPVTSLFPGQPLRVRVTDPDMNLSDTEKDKVSITARTTSGDAEPLILEETQPSSGVFEGALTTALSIGAGAPGRLEVFEGERAELEYIDQARAFGERNVPVQTKVAVGSLGVRLGDKRP